MKRKSVKTLNIAEAAKSYIRRKNGSEIPLGKVKYNWKWTPALSEKCNKCGSIATPSISWPNTMWEHCHSLEHVARLHGVSCLGLTAAVKALEKSGFKG